MKVPTSSSVSKPFLPTARVKRIINLLPGITQLSSEAVYLIGKAAELYAKYHGEKAGQICELKNCNKMEGAESCMFCFQYFCFYLLLGFVCLLVLLGFFLCFVLAFFEVFCFLMHTQTTLIFC